MIESIRHKGLKALFEDGDPGKVGPEHARRLRIILSALAAAETIRK